jgi:3-methyladenine DNA glycosylase AlkD
VRLVGCIRIELERNPEIRRRIGVEVRAGDAYNRVGQVSDRNRLSDDVWIAGEPPFPQAAADHRNVAAMRPIFVASKPASRDKLRAEDTEIPLRYMHAMHLLRNSPGQVHATTLVVRRHVLKDAGLLLPGVQFGGRSAWAVHFRAGIHQLHKPVRLGIVQRLQKHRIHDRKYRRIGPNAQSQGGNHRDGEPGILDEHVQCMFQVSARIAHCFPLRITTKNPFRRFWKIGAIDNRLPEDAPRSNSVSGRRECQVDLKTKSRGNYRQLIPMPTSPEIAAIAQEIRSRLNLLATHATAEVRSLRREFSRRIAKQAPENIHALAFALLRENSGTLRFIAYEILSSHRAAFQQLTADDILKLGKGLDSWSSVDTFAMILSGPAWAQGRLPDKLIVAWAHSQDHSKDRWWRRTALVSTIALSRRGHPEDLAKVFKICTYLVSDRDDMVVKALSWALREAAKKHPAEVKAFLAEHKEALAARVIREVRNKLSTGLKSPRKPKQNS